MAVQANESAFKEVGALKWNVKLGWFGAESAKPLALYGTAPWLPQLQELSHMLTTPGWKFSEGLAEQGVSASGKKTYTGKKQVMKASEQYPDFFTESVADFHQDVVHRSALTKLALIILRRAFPKTFNNVIVHVMAEILIADLFHSVNWHSQ